MRLAHDRAGRTCRRFAFAALAGVLLLARAVSGERLPLGVYTAANGLPHDRVTCLVRDSRGFLWFCTAGGLSRFDGERFVNYGVGQGLSHPSVNALIEAKDGTYWVATNGGGVCQFSPGLRRSANHPEAGIVASRLFDCLPVGEGLANRVNDVLIDRDGRLWAGTDDGLFQLEPADSERKFTRRSSSAPRDNVWAIAADAAGDVWVGGNRGLTRYGSGGTETTYAVSEPRGSAVWALLFDREGRLWVGHDFGLLVVRPLPVTVSDPRPPLWRTLIQQPAAGRSAVGGFELPLQPGEARTLAAADGLVIGRAGTITETSDGHIWIGSERWTPGVPGVVEFDGRSLRAYNAEHGLGEDPIIAIAEDRDRNIWLGMQAGGATRVARSGLVAYDDRDGLAPGRVHAIVAGQARDFYVVTEGLIIHRFDGARFAGIRPNVGSTGWNGFFQVPLVDRRGEWWIPTQRGLYRFPRVSRFEDLARATPVAVYGPAQGLPGTMAVNPFEDARGDIWFGILGVSAVVRWERESDRMHVYGEHDGMPRAGPPTAFREDRAGNLWIGFNEGAVARIRRGRFEAFRNPAEIPWGQIGTLYLDSTGRLWIGARDASLAYRPTIDALSGAQAPGPGEAELARVDEPDADTPRFFLYPPEVLSGDGVRSIAQDGSGTLYIGGDQGVQRLDPATGRVRRYTTADGLPSGDVEAAFIDAEGRLWLGTWRGAARFVPPTGSAAPPPSVLIGSLNVSGEPYPIAELGETEVSGLELKAAQNQLEVGFFALAFGTGRSPLYQYRLEGADADWGPPTTERRVTYVSLSPGPYRFLVRAVTADGAVTEPAAVSFVILRPVWQRPWFVALAALAGLLIAAAVYRARVARLLAVERMRTRIASDLHDDIGSSLSQIAVLTEVVRQRHPDDQELGAPLARIATTSREALESMNDIVWAINPRRDSLMDVVQRMRRFANDVLGARGIEFTFHAPADADQVRLGADVRRHVYLIFKEAVNNLARHAGPADAAIDLSLETGRLVLQVTDTGAGFDPAAADRGHGLASMRGRAAAIGASLEITAEPGRGTRLRLEVPLGRRTRRLRP